MVLEARRPYVLEKTRGTFLRRMAPVELEHVDEFFHRQRPGDLHIAAGRVGVRLRRERNGGELPVSHDRSCVLVQLSHAEREFLHVLARGAELVSAFLRMIRGSSRYDGAEHHRLEVVDGVDMFELTDAVLPPRIARLASVGALSAARAFPLDAGVAVKFEAGVHEAPDLHLRSFALHAATPHAATLVAVYLYAEQRISR